MTDNDTLLSAAHIERLIAEKIQACFEEIDQMEADGFIWGKTKDFPQSFVNLVGIHDISKAEYIAARLLGSVEKDDYYPKDNDD